MTLVELLLAIFVALILLAVIFPLSPRNRRPVKKQYARIEMADLATAIAAYDAEYHHLPLAESATNADLTCGISPSDISDFKPVDGARLTASNSDVVVILMDFDLGVNAGHKLNPKQIRFLNAKMVADTNSSGVSMLDHQYRDPWGKPYILSMDLTHAGQCSDVFYCRQNVSQFSSNSQAGLNGLFNPVDTNGNGNHFYLHGKVMVWSAGPDKKYDFQTPANSGVNKDNIVSWE